MIVNSKQLEDAATKISKHAYRKTIEGVPVTAAQCLTAARILREADPCECNGLKEERPGFIESEMQAPGVLVFQLGILTGHQYRILPNGEIDE